MSEAYKGKIPEDARQILISAGVSMDILDQALIDSKSKMARIVTRILGSAATTLGKTVLMRPEYFELHTNSGLALIAHEVTHISQWKKAGGFIFLLRYSGEFLFFSFKLIWGKIHKRPFPDYWVHDQISYEKAAIRIENDVLDFLLTRQSHQ